MVQLHRGGSKFNLVGWVCIENRELITDFFLSTSLCTEHLACVLSFNLYKNWVKTYGQIGLFQKTVGNVAIPSRGNSKEKRIEAWRSIMVCLGELKSFWYYHFGSIKDNVWLWGLEDGGDWIWSLKIELQRHPGGPGPRNMDLSL